MWSYFLVYGAGFLTGIGFFLVLIIGAMKLLGRRRKK